MSIRSFGSNVNQQGLSEYPRTSYAVPPKYYIGIVEDIILNDKNGKTLQYEVDGSNIGEIKVRILPDDMGLDIKELKSAFPMHVDFQSYPLVGEQVIVYKAMNRRFYSRAIASTRKITDNDEPLLRQVSAKANTELNADASALVRTGTQVGEVFRNIQAVEVSSMGKDYVRNGRARQVRANEGDITVHGRYGNVIRLGSSLFKDTTKVPPQPNILLTAGLWETPLETSTGTTTTPYSLVYENLDEDASSLWMVADQKVEFTPATQKSSSNPKAHLLSTPKKTTQYTGAQIFVNSDRVILNSKKNEISLFSNQGINLSALGAICLDTEDSVFLRSFADVNIKANNSISLEATEITITANSLSYKTPGDYIIQGKKVYLGTYGLNMEPMVLGRSLAKFLNSVLTQLQETNGLIDSIIKVLPQIPGAGPVVSPQLIAPTAKLQLTNSIVSALLTVTSPDNAIFNSSDNFTAKTNV